MGQGATNEFLIIAVAEEMPMFVEAVRKAETGKK
jgi:hypothetical protein